MYLILKRRLGEIIDIEFNGTKVEILVVEVCGHEGVRLGFKAPREVRIDRREVSESRQAQAFMESTANSKENRS